MDVVNVRDTGARNKSRFTTAAHSASATSAVPFTARTRCLRTSIIRPPRHVRRVGSADARLDPDAGRERPLAFEQARGIGSLAHEIVGHRQSLAAGQITSGPQ